MSREVIQRIRERIASFPKSPGVYLMKDRAGRVLYIGKAKDLRARAGSYFQESADLLNTRGPEIARMVGMVEEVDFVDTETEVDALLQESRLIKDIQPPFNARLRDDKTFPYVEITTGDDFPGVYVTRKPRPKGSRLYGPFVNAYSVREAVNALQRVFRFRTCELDIRADDDSRRFFRPCLLHAIERCTGPCGDRVSQEAYRKDIERLKRFMGSKRSTVLRQMTKEMEQAARELRYEDAAALRDRIRAIESLSLSGSPQEHVQPEVFFVDPARGLELLGALLEMESPPRTIEGIDIANLQGGESVGSLVCFVDGKPFKPGYRRFRIRSVEGQDDYAMIREVIVRRYRYAATGEELYPDVILIDGGLGQLHAALEAFGEMDIRPPMVLSLAKRQEEVFIQARSSPVRLPRNNEALRLLQQVRDEAHRSAQHYHHILRRKRTFDEEVSAGRRPPRRRGGSPQSAKGGTAPRERPSRDD
jgi:excinuclease ABC subunit C